MKFVITREKLPTYIKLFFIYTHVFKYDHKILDFFLIVLLYCEYIYT